MNLDQIGKQARLAARSLSRAKTSQKNAVLLNLADRLLTQKSAILAANAQDLELAQAQSLSSAMLDRLLLNPTRLESMAADLRSVASLPDPVGEIFDPQLLPNGLQVHKQRVALGVLAVIYESRPNVTIDISGLALKTGNAAILRGGSETMNSNRVLLSLARLSLLENNLPADALQLIDDPDRRLVFRAAADARHDRHAHPARRSGSASILSGEQPHPGDHRRDWNLPFVYRRQRRPALRSAGGSQCQGTAPNGLQCPGHGPGSSPGG